MGIIYNVKGNYAGSFDGNNIYGSNHDRIGYFEGKNIFNARHNRAGCQAKRRTSQFLV